MQNLSGGTRFKCYPGPFSSVSYTFTNSVQKAGYLRQNIGYLLGDYEVFRVKTYRYIFPLCKKFQFVGKEKPYPEYDKGMEQIEWERDRRKIKANIICLLDKLVA